MPDSGIYILTGPVRSGKTTALVNWSENRNDVQGILTPLAGERRVFMNAESREQFPMEAEADESAVLPIGRFRFSKKNFERAIQIIQESVRREGWLIIDEIGPLELKGEGFNDVLIEVLRRRKNKLLLVVREGFVEKVKELFGFTAEVIFAVNLGALK
jgi:nucleoside-triphosphatase THEP1